MFRRKDEEISQDLLVATDMENKDGSTMNTTLENTTPAEGFTGNATATAPAGAVAVPPYTRPDTARGGATPVYRPATAPAATPGSEAQRTGRVPEYRPATAPMGASALPASLTTAASAAFANDKSAATKTANRRVLTVGNDILLKGEIATCDRLVIEGAVDATLTEVHTVEIAEGGSFKGFAEIEDAEISGVFEGELVVRNRLVIYSTGEVRGKITYGEVEIERGGELTGDIKTIAQAGNKARTATKGKNGENLAAA